MIVSYNDLSRLRQENASRKLVFTGGFFDLVHEGHVAGLEFSRQQGDLLVVGVCSDEHTRERKGLSRPIRHEAGRLAVINAFRCVDYTFLMPTRSIGSVTPTMQAIVSLRPDVYVEEAAQAERWESRRDTLASVNTELVLDDQPKLDSTTAIVERVVADAAVAADF